MGFKCGIVGLPNVGKSTLFNALTASKNAEAANFPFCTIDPNIGIVDVVDERLDKLAKLSKSKKKIYFFFFRKIFLLFFEKIVYNFCRAFTHGESFFTNIMK